MALPESVISGGTNVGTSGNDDLSTSEYDIMTAIATIYSALSGLGGDDNLDNNGQVENVTLDGGADNDRIYNTVNGGGQSPSIVGGDGDDVIENGYATDQLKANDATIDAGAGADNVDNYGDNALINLDDGNDSLYNVGDNAIISAGEGADNVSHFGDDSSIDAGAGDDTVGGYGNNVTVRGGAGNDSLQGYRKNDSGNVKILLDDTQGNNSFSIGYSTNSTINAGAGDDTISADYSNENLLINAGAGNNSIVTQYGDGVTINAADGSDTITINDGSNFVVNAGDGANVIENHQINDTTASGHTITSGAGNDSITNRVANALINAGDGNNYVINGAYGSGGGSGVTINTGSGNDFINNYYDYEHARGDKQENVIINSGAGNDTVTNSTDKVTIDGGAGNDELSSYDSSDVSINGGAGSDTIFIANGTVSGGAGDDSLSAGDNVLIQYNSGDGNDLIDGFDGDDTISIGGGNYSSVISGSDVILTVGDGNVTLSGAAELQTLNIIGNGSNEIPNSDNDVVVTGTNAAEKFENKGYNVTINALGGNDTIFNYGNGVSINAGKGNDEIHAENDSDVTIRYASGDGNDSVYGHMSDDGAMNYKLQITGAPYSSVIRGDNVILSVDNGSILLYGAADAASMGGINIEGTLAGGDSDVIENTVNNTLVTGTAYDDTIINSADNVTIQALGGNDSIFGATRGNSNIIIDAGDGNDVIETYGSNISVNAGNGNDSIHIFHNVYATVLAGAGNDTIFNTATDAVLDGGEGNDFIHNDLENVTITGGADDDIIENYGDNVVFNYSAGDGNDLISGFNANDTLSISGGNYSSVISGSNVIIGVGTDSITLDGAASLSALNIVGTLGGGGDTQSGDILRGTEGNDNLHTWIESGNSIVGAFSEVYGLGGNDTIQNFLPMQLNVKITQADIEKATLDGGNANDYIQNDAAQCLIVGGEGNDTINNTNSDYYNTTHSGGTLNGGAGNDSIFSQDFNKTTISGGNGNDTIFHNGGVNVSISGGAGNDSIRSKAYGVIVGLGTGTNTINGGAGSDIVSISHITASVEPYVIEYASGDGNDTIYGFTSYDTLSITNGSYTSVKSGNNVIIGVGTDSITLDGAASLSALNIVGTLGGGGDTTTAATVAQMILYRTEAGYPVIAGMAFHPEEYHGDEPTNYAAKETWSIQSAEGLELSGVHYTPENSNDKWVVIIHGYGHNHKHMYPFAGFYLDNGYNVLMVDQRAAGDSEGEWLTMGAAESQDIALWTQEIARRNPDAKITLFGVSMGSATAMLAASRSDTANVTSLVEDCGYTNMMDVVRLLHSNIPAMQSLLSAQDLTVLDTVASIFTGYNLSDAAPLNSISAAKMPSLFITGTNDTVVPVSALTALYDASGAEVKEQFIVDGATHGVAGLYDPVGYSNTVFRFLAEANKEGWATENIYDGISLRGTSYNDTITNSGTSVTIQALGGDDYLVNDVDSSVTTASLGNFFDAGTGNDTIYSHHSYNPTLIGGDGNDSIVVSRGHMTYIDAGNGDDSIIGSLTGGSSDWHMGGHATILGGDGNDLLDIGYSDYSSIDTGNGNDTIITNGIGATIDAGAGNNLIRVTDVEKGETGQFIVLSGNTTVENFGTGFGDGTDTILADEAPSVDFKSGGLTFYNGTDSITLVDVTTTEKVNLYYTSTDNTELGIFIADDDWYSVESSDLTHDGDNEGLYFVGATAKMNHGVDFSGISSNLNVTLDTDYNATPQFWVNNVYSLKGGAGLTTITGSDKSDTILAGTGTTTIDAAGDDDFISLTSARALVNYASGDGNDLIDGFNANSTISISGAAYSSVVSGDDVILTVGDEEIILSNAANLETLNIVGTLDGGDTTPSAGINVDNTVNNTLITGTSYNDTITNSGTNVTIDALGGDDYLINDVDSSVTTASLGNFFDAGAGNDTIYSHHSYNPTLRGGDGNDSIVVSRGHMTYIDAGNGDDSIIGSLTGSGSGDWHMGGHATILGGDGNDLLDIGYSDYSSIDAGNGNDTIITNGIGATIDAGAGNNLIRVTDVERGETGQILVLDGNTTIENFGLGFGDGTDTIYIKGAPAGVDFRSDGLTFYRDNDIFTLSDVSTTAKVNIYHERRTMLNKGVFIGDNEWYSVESSDLSVKSGEEVYFVGTSATGHGVDFSGITENLNVTLDTEYEIPNNSIWINGVYSIRGGAGLTTITGSDKSDTIFAGTGATTIDAAGGNDFISLTSARALVEYTNGDGNDLIDGFNTNSTLNISGAAYSSVASGNNLILTVGSGHITLEGAATLSTVNINGTLSGGSSTDTSSGGGSSSGGSSSSSGGTQTTSEGVRIATPSNPNHTNVEPNTDLTTITNPTPSTSTSATSNVYTGGNAVISNYTSGQPVTVGSFTGASFDANGNFVVQSATGALVIENAVDKVIDLRDGNGNAFVKAYTASTPGIIDGRGLAGFEMINGSAAGSDWIVAGDGGSQLWGGDGFAADVMFGGAGTDIFVGGKNQGADVFANASSADVVNLNDATLSDIVATAEVNGAVLIGFNTGNIVSVQSTEPLSAAVQLADGSAYRYNHVTKSWQTA